MRNLLLAALVLVTAACGAYRFPGGPPPGNGTVSGTVLAFTCVPIPQPVAQPPSPCVRPCLPIAQPAAQPGPMCVNPCLPIAQPGAQPAQLCVSPCPPIAQPPAQPGTMCVNPCLPIAQPAALPAQQCASPCPPIAQPAGQAPPKCPAPLVGGGVAATCFPVESAAVAQCAGRPIPGVEIDFTNGGETAKAVTDSAGHFTAVLAAGTWSVHLVTTMQVLSGPQQVTVVSGSTLTATYILDSRILVPVPQQ